MFIAVPAAPVLVGIASNFSGSSDSDKDNEDEDLVGELFTRYTADFWETNTRKGRDSHLVPQNELYVALQFYATAARDWVLIFV